MKKRKGKKEISQYKKCWNYFKESKNYIITAVAIFALFFLIGYFFPIFFSDKIMEILKQLASQIEGKNIAEVISFIFLNNLKASFVSLFFGLFFALFPLGALIINGYVAGFASNMAVSKEGILVLWRLFPHGIFELPAVLISMGLGLRFGTIILGKKSIKEEFIQAGRFFVMIIVPLLIIAAVIEGLLVFFLS